MHFKFIVFYQHLNSYFIPLSKDYVLIIRMAQNMTIGNLNANNSPDNTKFV